MITVRLFSVLKDRAGTACLEVPSDGVRTVEEASRVVFERYPQLAPYRASIRFARNQVYARPDERIEAGDELAFITPVSGG